VRRIQYQLAAVGEPPCSSRSGHVTLSFDDGSRRSSPETRALEHAHRDPGVAGLDGSAQSEATDRNRVRSGQHRINGAPCSRATFDHGKRFRRDVADDDRRPA
jgi:hypothetical protein